MLQTGEGPVPLWLRGVTIAFGVFLLALVALANSGEATRLLLGVAARIPGGDKTVHFVLMGSLSMLVNLCWRARRWRIGPMPLLKGTVVVAVLVTLEEFSQIYVRSRSFSIEDLAYDYLGIVLLGELAACIVWWQRRSQASANAAVP